jgi:hypothetical protein
MTLRSAFSAGDGTSLDRAHSQNNPSDGKDDVSHASAMLASLSDNNLSFEYSFPWHRFIASLCEIKSYRDRKYGSFESPTKVGKLAKCYSDCARSRSEQNS